MLLIQTKRRLYIISLYEAFHVANLNLADRKINIILN